MVNLKTLALTALSAGLLGGAAAFGGPAAFAQTTAASPAPAAASMAPEAGTPHRHHNKMMTALKSLSLSDDQRSKIKDLMTSFRNSRDSATPETRAQLRTQIEGVLTPDQRTQFETEMKAHTPAAGAPAR